MSDVKSDIQIAREAKMQPINDILAKINVPDESLVYWFGTRTLQTDQS